MRTRIMSLAQRYVRMHGRRPTMKMIAGALRVSEEVVRAHLPSATPAITARPVQPDAQGYHSAGERELLWEGVVPDEWAALPNLGIYAGRYARIYFEEMVREPTVCEKCDNRFLRSGSDEYGYYISCINCGWVWNPPDPAGLR